MTESVATAHNRAVALRVDERFDDALAAIETTLRLGPPRPESRLMRAHILCDLGQFDEAVDTYQKLLFDHPDIINGHQTLSSLLPQIGRRPEALESYKVALSKRPDVGMLWVSAFAMARGLGDWSALLAFAHEAEARFGKDTLITVYHALALSGLALDAEARDMLSDAIAVEPGYAPARTTLAHVLTRLGDYEAAEAEVLLATAITPHDQAAWALLSAIWRVRSDPREAWLADYDRHVIVTDVPGVGWHALGENLKRRHRAFTAPGDQSLRGGTQTRGILFNSPSPDIQHLKHVIVAAAGVMLAQLPKDPTHPFLSRNTGNIDFVGSWSVRLRSQGFHISHMHPEGWLSSALYIDLPPEVDGNGDAGALGFGVPDTALNLNFEPRRIVRPKVGQLVIFPSYLWHGTLPFESAQDRLTVAFDAIPVAAG
jgi:protein involved in temperature-dependent protein secretion